MYSYTLLSLSLSAYLLHLLHLCVKQRWNKFKKRQKGKHRSHTPFNQMSLEGEIRTVKRRTFFFKELIQLGVPSVAQWVKNAAAVAWLAAEAWVQSPAQHCGLRDLVLLQLRRRSQLWLRFNPWPWNFHMAWVCP